jgi:hypothetical protein
MINKEDMMELTTDDLINELKRRNPDGCMIAVQLPEHEQRSTGNSWRVSFGGNAHITLKLANICVWMHQKTLMGVEAPE